MFLNFFESLRKHGINVTLGEWLDLMNALDSGLIGGSLTRFYYGAKMILVRAKPTLISTTKLLMSVLRRHKATLKSVRRCSDGLINPT